MEGAFEIHPDYPAEKLEELVRMNGGALLYGAAREMVIMLTSRCKNGPLDLPSVDAKMFLTMQPIKAGESSVKNDS
jgi:preprotein translocase subunit SecB